MNRNVDPGWMWLTIGIGLSTVFVKWGFDTHWSAVGGQLVFVLLLGGSLLLMISGIAKIRRPGK